jgi:hypothetical protein
MVKGDKEIFTKLISTYVGKPLIVRDRSGLLMIIVMVIRDETWDGLSVIIFLWSSLHTCYEKIHRLIIIKCNTHARSRSYIPGEHFALLQFH